MFCSVVGLAPHVNAVIKRLQERHIW